MPRDHCLCECELPGYFHSGVPGILAAMEDGRVAPGAVVERCDQCRRYPTDAAAHARLCALGITNSATPSRPTFTVHCYAVVRVTFPGVVAEDARAAAEQVRDRFDWDTHRHQAEDADEIVDLLVDVDGDADFAGSRRFAVDLTEITVPSRPDVAAQPEPVPAPLIAPPVHGPIRKLLSHIASLWSTRFDRTPSRPYSAPGRLIVFVVCLTVSGCRDDSARVAAVAHQALESQAEQNKELARLSGEVVASSQQLVEQDAQARTEILAAQQNLQTQHSDLSQQRDDLEHERRRIANQRQTESLLAPILLTLGTALLCLLPVGVAGYALYLSRGSVPEMADVGQILVEELVSDSPRLLSPPAQPTVPCLEPPADEPTG